MKIIKLFFVMAAALFATVVFAQVPEPDLFTSRIDLGQLINLAVIVTSVALFYFSGRHSAELEIAKIKEILKNLGEKVDSFSTAIDKFFDKIEKDKIDTERRIRAVEDKLHEHEVAGHTRRARRVS
jgi:hypothetical protein